MVLDGYHFKIQENGPSLINISVPAKFSFLIPAYKDRYLEETLRSILCQTYRNFNIIVSDDCSPFDIKKIVERFHDERLKYRRNEVNIGAEHLACHWNMLLDITDAEYVILSSDDDMYEPEFLEEINKLIVANPSVNLFRPKIDFIDDSWNTIAEEHINLNCVMTQEEFVYNIVFWRLRSGLQQHVFNRAALKTDGGMADYPYAWFSDDELIMRMSNNGIAITSKVLFHFRCSDISISSGKQTFSMMKGKIKAASEYYRDFMEYRFTDEMISANLERVRNITMSGLMRLGKIDFLRGLRFCHYTDKALFPTSWCYIKFKIRFYSFLDRIFGN